MVIATNRIVNCLLLLGIITLTPACVQGEDKAVDEKAENQAVTEEQATTTKDLELLASLSTDAKLETLKKAWSLFKPKLEWVGPEKNRLLRIEIRTESNADMIEANISETKGVVAVQRNYVRRVLKPQQ